MISFKLENGEEWYEIRAIPKDSGGFFWQIWTDWQSWTEEKDMRRVATCRSCDAAIRWIKRKLSPLGSPNGKNCE